MEKDGDELPEWSDELIVPWGNLISNIFYKYELDSLHLIGRAVVAEELAQEQKLCYDVSMYGVA